ncbi:glycoside hydrolase family 5 protein [Ascoidea rubescens DSM 1968]|uniref:Glycoside hydrolase family 5 protein n=1 Tax=Ascoidea rubescens DSM 1968 TaxID=1344418 RepID=A0A1D2VDE3_9ASCO|nr:glycoside hydrolase family 5 protein [Ascoidea rubescens DSM 1968]ODV59602.1 glycoside hydrolase family 5 protein [Ascoidea rubescens DSM 1968]
MFSYLKHHFKDYSIETPSQAPIAPGQPPNQRNIYQLRKNFGVNLGSIFILESFMYGDFFINNTKAELDCITEHVSQNGLDATRQLLENHWKSFMTDEDWQYLKQIGVTSVRIPIGYWEINSGFINEDTPFEDISAVYQNAWDIYKKFYIEKASTYNISVLVDLHALPGGANTGDHSGQILSEPEFWSSTSYRIKALKCLKFIASDILRYDNIAGLQIVNESVFSSDGESQDKYYRQAIHDIRKKNPDVPIIISDGWSPNQWVKWVNNLELEVGGYLGLVIDSHVYRCFSEDDKSKNPDQIISELDETVFNPKTLEGQADILVGEYSCVLDSSSWEKFNGNRDEKVKEYGQALSFLFNQRTSGFYFWTYKFQYGDGGEWGFPKMVKDGAIPQRQSYTQRIPDENEFNTILNSSFNDHSNYWNSQNPNEAWEHDRYKEGFITGWNDSVEFSKFDGSKIGRINAIKTARKNEHIYARGSSDKIWEWDSGYTAGIEEFQKAAF